MPCASKALQPWLLHSDLANTHKRKHTVFPQLRHYSAYQQASAHPTPVTDSAKERVVFRITAVFFIALFNASAPLCCSSPVKQLSCRQCCEPRVSVKVFELLVVSVRQLRLNEVPQSHRAVECGRKCMQRRVHYF